MSHPLEDFLPFTAPWVRGAPEPAMLAAIRRSAINFCTRSQAWRQWLNDINILAYGGAPTSVVGITIASPGVVSWAASGLAENQKILLRTTGVLPTGLDTETTYFWHIVDTNSGNLMGAAGGTPITTSGVQSGVHTAIAPQPQQIVTLTTPTDSQVLSIQQVRFSGIDLEVDTEDSRRATGLIEESTGTAPVLYGSTDVAGLTQLTILPIITSTLYAALRVRVWLIPTQAALTLPDWLYNRYAPGVGHGAAALLHGSSEEWANGGKVDYYQALANADIGAAHHWAKSNGVSDARVTKGSYR